MNIAMITRAVSYFPAVHNYPGCSMGALCVVGSPDHLRGNNRIGGLKTTTKWYCLTSLLLLPLLPGRSSLIR